MPASLRCDAPHLQSLTAFHPATLRPHRNPIHSPHGGMAGSSRFPHRREAESRSLPRANHSHRSFSHLTTPPMTTALFDRAEAAFRVEPGPSKGGNGLGGYTSYSGSIRSARSPGTPPPAAIVPASCRGPASHDRSNEPPTTSIRLRLSIVPIEDSIGMNSVLCGFHSHKSPSMKRKRLVKPKTFGGRKNGRRTTDAEATNIVFSCLGHRLSRHQR